MSESIKCKWTGWKIENKKIYRCEYSTYWYFWGDKLFDIREVRAMVGMKKHEYTMDLNYYKNPCSNNERIMMQLEAMADGKDFAAIINEAEQRRHVNQSKLDKANIPF